MKRAGSLSACVFAGLLGSGSAALAESQKWELTDVRFNDGAVATGYFILSPPTRFENFVVSSNVVIRGGTTAFSPSYYGSLADNPFRYSRDEGADFYSDSSSSSSFDLGEPGQYLVVARSSASWPCSGEYVCRRFFETKLGALFEAMNTGCSN